jgi:hypothetical protein
METRSKFTSFARVSLNRQLLKRLKKPAKGVRMMTMTILAMVKKPMKNLENSSALKSSN